MPALVNADSIAFGAAIRERRTAQSLTQEELASVIGVHRRVIGELERGKPTVRIQIALDAARALGLDLHLEPRP